MSRINYISRNYKTAIEEFKISYGSNSITAFVNSEKYPYEYTVTKYYVMDLASYFAKRINESDLETKEVEIRSAILRFKKMAAQNYSSEVANDSFKEVLDQKTEYFLYMLEDFKDAPVRIAPVEKIRWNNSGKDLAVLFVNLVMEGLIDIPVAKNGPSISKLARACHTLFDTGVTEQSLVKAFTNYISGEIKEETVEFPNSFKNKR